MPIKMLCTFIEGLHRTLCFGCPLTADDPTLVPHSDVYDAGVRACGGLF